MASAAPAARVEDPFGHSSAMNGVMIGLAVGALIGTAILTGGVSLIAVGAAVAITGGAGMAGQAIGQTIPGPDSGVITIGSPNVSIDRRAAAMTVLATGPCSKDSGPPVPVATGAKTVRINNQLAARVGETMACSAVIRRGSAGVFIGGPSETVIKPTPEVPVWLENGMLAMAIGGTAIGTLGVGLTYGAGAAVGSLVGGMAGGHFGGQAASAGAAALGYGATGQAIAGVAGGMLGGALGGGAGFRGGQMAGNKIWSSPETPLGVRMRQGTSGGDPATIAGANRINNAVARMPPEFQAKYAQAQTAGWRKPDDTPWWPPNDGAIGKPEFTKLPPGTPVDRYGKETGYYLGRPRDGISERALAEPPKGDPNRYRVTDELPVEKAEIAPWFGERGGGEQYRMVDLDKPLDAKGNRPSMSVEKAKEMGMLEDMGEP